MSCPIHVLAGLLTQDCYDEPEFLPEPYWSSARELVRRGLLEENPDTPGLFRPTEAGIELGRRAR